MMASEIGGVPATVNVELRCKVKRRCGVIVTA